MSDTFPPPEDVLDRCRQTRSNKITDIQFTFKGRENWIRLTHIINISGVSESIVLPSLDNRIRFPSPAWLPPAPPSHPLAFPPSLRHHCQRIRQCTLQALCSRLPRYFAISCWSPPYDIARDRSPDMYVHERRTEGHALTYIYIYIIHEIDRLFSRSCTRV